MRPGYVRCIDCGAEGPVLETHTLARRWAQDNGWSRLYAGFRCAECRATPVAVKGTAPVNERVRSIDERQTVRVSSDLWAELKRAADARDVSTRWLAAQLLREGLKRLPAPGEFRLTRDG